MAVAPTLTIRRGRRAAEMITTRRNPSPHPKPRPLNLVQLPGRGPRFLRAHAHPPEHEQQTIRPAPSFRLARLFFRRSFLFFHCSRPSRSLSPGPYALSPFTGARPPSTPRHNRATHAHTLSVHAHTRCSARTHTRVAGGLSLALPPAPRSPSHSCFGRFFFSLLMASAIIITAAVVVV